VLVAATRRNGLPAARFRIKFAMASHWCFIIHFGLSPAFLIMMESQSAAVAPPHDITFACSHCHSALVVDAAAAGMTLDCQRCGKPTPVPMVAPRDNSSADAQSKMADIQRRLKENESQRTEITGYINQLSIQLHRWQLRLHTLNERKTELDEELRKTS
jgi:transcription elongation factor Elf1